MVGFLFISLFYYAFISLGNSMQITYFGTVHIPATTRYSRYSHTYFGTVDIPTPAWYIRYSHTYFGIVDIPASILVR
jgi:hypothetical protein